MSNTFPSASLAGILQFQQNMSAIIIYISDYLVIPGSRDTKSRRH